MAYLKEILEIDRTKEKTAIIGGILMKLKLLLLVAVILVTMTGCIGYSEEMWINDNGSGKVDVEVKIAESIATASGQNNPLSDENLKKTFENVKGIKVTEMKSFKEDGNEVAVIAFNFDSLEALRELNKAKPGFIGETTLTKNEKGQIVFERKLGSGSESQDPQQQAMAKALFSQYVWTYKIHFPYIVASANVEKESIDKSSNTVTWSVPMTNIQSQTMTATLESPTLMSYLIPVGIVALLIAGLFLLIMIIKGRRKAKAEVPTETPAQ